MWISKRNSHNDGSPLHTFLDVHSVVYKSNLYINSSFEQNFYTVLSSVIEKMKFKIFIFIIVLNKTEAITDRLTTITLPSLLPIISLVLTTSTSSIHLSEQQLRQQMAYDYLMKHGCKIQVAIPWSDIIHFFSSLKLVVNIHG